MPASEAFLQLSPSHLSWSELAGWAFLVVTLYVLFQVVHQLYLSPLSKFPGPKLAAVTRGYETFYDLIKGGQYTFKIEEMHKQYGPIVRISPYELHISDPEYYDVLYAGFASPRNKWDYYTRQFGSDDSAFSTVDHQHHRLRRGALNPFFSKQRINNLQGLVWDLADKLCERLEGHRPNGKPVPLRHAYSCLTTDAITSYAFNKSWGFLDSEDYSPQWCEAIKATASYSVLMKHIPWMFKIVKTMPGWLIRKIDEGMGMIVEDVQRPIEHDIAVIIQNNDSKQYNLDGGQPTIFHQLINSNLPASEKTLSRLAQEGQVVIGAGADTTGNALTVITFHVLDNPRILAKLRTELLTVMPETTSHPKIDQLEALPYLTAVINEGLRLSYGVSSRSQRIAPNEIMKYRQWEIPAGTPVGMTSTIMHHDESIFPNSWKFSPERWIEATKAGKPLDKYLMTFSKGTRVCLGMQLGKAEIYITLAAIFRRFQLELFETTRKDVDIKHDLFLPQPDQSSKGVRVLVH